MFWYLKGIANSSISGLSFATFKWWTFVPFAVFPIQKKKHNARVLPRWPENPGRSQMSLALRDVHSFALCELENGTNLLRWFTVLFYVVDLSSSHTLTVYQRVYPCISHFAQAQCPSAFFLFVVGFFSQIFPGSFRPVGPVGFSAAPVDDPLAILGLWRVGQLLAIQKFMANPFFASW